MQFSDRAAYCRVLLQQSYPLGFYKNRKGIMQKTILACVILRSNNTLSIPHEQSIYYTEQDQNNAQPEAQLVRMGIWKPKDVGWLWTYLPGGTLCFLAKVTPKEKTDLNPGWITERSVFVIDADFSRYSEI